MGAGDNSVVLEAPRLARSGCDSAFPGLLPSTAAVPVLPRPLSSSKHPTVSSVFHWGPHLSNLEISILGLLMAHRTMETGYGKGLGDFTTLRGVL